MPINSYHTSGQEVVKHILELAHPRFFPLGHGPGDAGGGAFTHPEQGNCSPFVNGRASLPASSTKKSASYDAKRTVLTPRALANAEEKLGVGEYFGEERGGDVKRQ